MMHCNWSVSSIYLPTYLPIYLPIYLSIYLPTYLPSPHFGSGLRVESRSTLSLFRVGWRLRGNYYHHHHNYRHHLHYHQKGIIINTIIITVIIGLPVYGMSMNRLKRSLAFFSSTPIGAFGNINSERDDYSRGKADLADSPSRCGRSVGRGSSRRGSLRREEEGNRRN